MLQPPLLLTVGEIARRLDAKVHRIEYVIRSRNIEATGWAGHARVFAASDLTRIASELRRMELVCPVNVFDPRTCFLQNCKFFASY